ncbi:MAG: nitroreductase family protein [Deltaproteobacteria bacterium]|nr:nitroreductase family protein [Deltaproteobacteria bacterium]
MDVPEAVGRRRSIRFLLPHKPVELDKIQRMLEAARLASHWGNVSTLRAVVIRRDTADAEVLAALPPPVAGYQIGLAPVIIVWFLESAACDQVGTRLRELVDAGAIGYGPGRRQEVEAKLVPLMESASEILKQPGLSEVDCGQGIAQATLMAVAMGLGTCCLGTGDPDRVRRKLGLPESCRVLVIQTVGYPAESPEAGGQRPRLPFESLFHLNRYGEPFPRDPRVVAELQAEKLLQPEAPLAWREAELAYLQRALDLKGQGLLE